MDTDRPNPLTDDREAHKVVFANLAITEEA